jgi:hypothetical protein
VVVGNAFSHCNHSSAFSSWEAVSPIKVIIWNDELLMGFERCLLRAELHLYESLSAVYRAYSTASKCHLH